MSVLLLAFAVIFIASAIQGSIGFGANVFAVPILALIEPSLVPGPVIFAGFGINVLMLLRDRHSASLQPITSAIVGRVVGTVIGVVALGLLSQEGLSVLVAVTVLAIVGASLLSVAPKRSARNLLVAGTVSGFSASTAGIGGPPVALMFQDAEGPEVRGSLGAFFVLGNIVSLIGLALAGKVGGEEVRLGLSLAPAAVLGFVSTRWLLPIVDRGFTRPAIVGLSAAAAVALIGKLLIG